MAGESNDAYFKRITAAASDPQSFERMALGMEDETISSTSTSTSSTSSPSASSKRMNGADDNTVKPNGGGYVRAEEWEKQLLEDHKNGKLSWEEKVQFDGQRYGNQFNQNEILRKNLKGF